MESTSPITIESATEALMAPMESEAAEVNNTDVEVAEVEETEVEQESELETDDDAEYAELEDEDDGGDEYEESDDTLDDQTEPETYSVKVNGETVDVTLSDLTKSYSGQKYIQQGMKQAAEARKQAEEAYNGLNQQRQQLDQFMQRVGQKGLMLEPTPPTKDLLSADPLGYIEADATYREEMGQYQIEQHELKQNHEAMKVEQAKADKANLDYNFAELKRVLPDFADANKATKMKERLLKQGIAEDYTAEEIGGIIDYRAMRVLNKARLYDQIMAGNSTVESKLKKARPLMKAGTKKLPDSAAKKQRQQMSKLKKTGSIHDAASLLFSS